MRVGTKLKNGVHSGVVTESRLGVVSVRWSNMNYDCVYDEQQLLPFVLEQKGRESYDRSRNYRQE
ncbi:hypothetical protein QB910_000096 [Dabrowskivirus KKP3916]|uniref:Uncharacterized protein n=1 Tax=Alicyclobacillus phage KKP_3916 TaxID=3040651 RepID=A0AAT9V8K5_9CAUD|nr:hypothetical protein QB910_000096 [Alicyclobacillus phage KKP 3916]